ncbi:MAG: RdgB/HAM1 family non-canonical purine NTP pyrophosphatase [Acidobacteriota bacterium]|nr:RdgB/HAM1 family non-canonical purine NTP pyrophosphatase [Acidobacteriota bacterium]
MHSIEATLTVFSHRIQCVLLCRNGNFPETMKTLLLGTKNRGKVSELCKLISGLNLEIKGLDEFPAISEPVETGDTFDENARIKATYYARRLKCPVLADDSGLEVDFLDGRPGVFSARFAGINASDTENIEKLIALLNGVESSKRGARFRCAMSIASPAGTVLTTVSGSCNGCISSKPRGINGFGYDSVFIPDGYDKTFGELPLSIKQSLSHRAKAARKLVDFLAANLGLLT